MISTCYHLIGHRSGEAATLATSQGEPHYSFKPTFASLSAVVASISSKKKKPTIASLSAIVASVSLKKNGPIRRKGNKSE